MYNAHCVEEISNRSWQASNMDALKNSLMTYHVEGVSGRDPQKKLRSFTAVVWEQLADVRLAAETDSDWVNAASWRHVRALAHIATQPPHQHRSAAARWKLQQRAHRQTLHAVMIDVIQTVTRSCFVIVECFPTCWRNAVGVTASRI